MHSTSHGSAKSKWGLSGWIRSSRVWPPAGDRLQASDSTGTSARTRGSGSSVGSHLVAQLLALSTQPTSERSTSRAGSSPDSLNGSSGLLTMPRRRVACGECKALLWAVLPQIGTGPPSSFNLRPKIRHASFVAQPRPHTMPAHQRASSGGLRELFAAAEAAYVTLFLSWTSSASFAGLMIPVGLAGQWQSRAPQAARCPLIP
ncbi:hypothetical protein VTI74DRAFT_657 [Chaetomium olivicolor]